MSIADRIAMGESQIESSIAIILRPGWYVQAFKVECKDAAGRTIPENINIRTTPGVQATMHDAIRQVMTKSSIASAKEVRIVHCILINGNESGGSGGSGNTHTFNVSGGFY